MVIDSIKENQANFEVFEKYYKNSARTIDRFKPFIDEIFLSYFDEAKKCKTTICKREVSNKIHKALQANLFWANYEATYFIRVNEKNNIEKLFLDARWKEERVDNSQERKVVNYLKNPNSKEYLKGILIKHFHYNMIYLNDFYSEGEIIIPVKKDNKIIGAMVKLYGQ